MLFFTESLMPVKVFFPPIFAFAFLSNTNLFSSKFSSQLELTVFAFFQKQNFDFCFSNVAILILFEDQVHDDRLWYFWKKWQKKKTNK